MEEKPGKRIKYGHYWPVEYDDLHIELAAFRLKLPIEKGGLGRLGHYQNICKIFWPTHKASEWSNIMQAEFCGDSRLEGPLNIVVTGPGAASKSTEAAKFAVVWQQMAPLKTAIPVTSTAVNMAKRRIWAEITSMWEKANAQVQKKFKRGIAGHLLMSSSEIQAVKGDSKHAIAIVPGSPKYSKEGTKKIQGWHAEYVLILADELQDMTPEIIESCVNMKAGTKEFIFIGLGNGNSWLNTLGQTMMPESGNPEDVTVEMPRWNTVDGICLHLDGLQSPNILDPGKYPWLLGQKEIGDTIRKHGEDSVQYWQMVRGFPPPDGSINAVVPESMLMKFRCMTDEDLLPGWKWMAGLDPAFIGDDCVLKFAKVGTFKDGSRRGVVFADRHNIRAKSSHASEPLDYQIAHQVIAMCKERGVAPEDFALDCTGSGRGVAAIIRKEWSNEIHLVEFGGSPSDLPVSELDPTKGIDAYANRSTELWWGFRIFCVNGQVRGVSNVAAREFGCRTYITVKGKALIQTKSEVKKTLGRSPDEADASVLIIDNMRFKGFFAGPHGYDEGWDKRVREVSEMQPEYAPTDELLIS